MSTLAGGETYKWKGVNVRTLTIDTSSCVALPRKDSYILVPISIKNTKKVKIIIEAKNVGGSNALLFELYGPYVSFQKIQVKLVSAQFKEYFINLENVDLEKTNIKISKSDKSTGTVVLKKIGYQVEGEEVKVIEPTYQQKIGKDQKRIADEFRRKESNSILAARNDYMAVIGGNGYRWRGKGIRSVYKNNFSCIELTTKDSSIMVPVTVVSGGTYKITISALVGGGNGELTTNFFGGQEFDGKQIAFRVLSHEFGDYNITTSVPKFPANLPIYLRIWRPQSSSGKIYIKIIQYSRVDAAAPQPIKKNKVSEKVVKNINKEPVNKKIISKELESMIFRPYTLNKKNSTSEVTKVLITKAEDVPKVSIITPTRDGLELIKKCHDAIVKNTAYPNWEWIIGDSKSSDGTVEYIKSLQDVRIKLIERGTTDGSFSSINNELTKFASGSYYLFLNDDTEPQSFWLYEMMSKIKHNPQIGIVGAKLMYNSEKVQHAGIMFIPPGPANVGKDLLKIVPGGFELWDRFYQAVTGACLLISKKDFDAVGGFDPAYYFCYEDVDLCLKVKYQLNKQILYAANAVVFHRESVTQKKYGTSGEKQRAGIQVFKQRWMHRPNIVDVHKYSGGNSRNLYPVQISFVTCINNAQQYNAFIVSSLFNNKTNKNYEIIPIFNFNNQYSAAQALNIGIKKARANIVVLCHQDVIFFQNWIEMLFERIKEIESKDKNWGVLGTAGIDTADNTLGVVYNVGGSFEWRSTTRSTYRSMQTLDEHCMILRKDSNLRFDEQNFDGFHFYGADICLNAISRGMKNYGILCPLVHNSGSSGSLGSGQKEFTKFLNALAKKWRNKFKTIRTPTSMITKNRIQTFIKFRK